MVVSSVVPIVLYRLCCIDSVVSIVFYRWCVEGVVLIVLSLCDTACKQALAQSRAARFCKPVRSVFNSNILFSPTSTQPLQLLQSLHTPRYIKDIGADP